MILNSKHTYRLLFILGFVLFFIIPFDPSSFSLTINTLEAQSCSIRRDYWTNINSVEVSTQSLTIDPRFPASPTGTEELTIFEGPTDWGDNYGDHIFGYVLPPETGNYTFWIAGDDNVDLYLSTSEDPYQRKLIATNASVAYDSWGYFTNPREWDKYASQQSAPIPLVAGQRYFIEARHRENSGGDNIAVGWQLPSGSYERPIPCSRLATFIGAFPEACPYSPQPNRTIIQLADSHVSIAANQGIAEATFGPVSASILPGTYDVTLVTQDYHWGNAPRDGETPLEQLREQYKLILTGAGGVSLGETNPISDLPWDKEWITEKVETEMVIPQTITQVTAFHPAFYESISQRNNPICAVFDKIQQPAEYTCPFIPQANRTIATFNSEGDDPYIYDTGSFALATAGPVTAPLSSGQYKISLYIFDRTHPRASTEPDERWVVQFLNSSGSVVATSSSSIDLGDSEVTRIDVVDNNLSIPAGVNRVRSFMPTWRNNGPVKNEVKSWCAAFDKLSTPPGGNIRRDYWLNIGGGEAVYDLMRSSIGYPNSPTGTELLPIFEGPTDWNDNYGNHIYGYVTAPITGNYTFWIAGDDNSDLFLSPNENPYDRVFIASNNIKWYDSSGGNTGSQEWDKFGYQKSDPIPLVAGQRYFIEARQKEGGGGDNIAVGWQLPSGALERPIPGSRLSVLPGPYPDSCPLTPQPDRTIIQLMNRSIGIVASGNLSDASYGPVSANLPAGAYDITLVTFDNHTGISGMTWNGSWPAIDDQYREQSKLLLNGAGGVSLGETNPTSDIPWNKEWVTEKVNTGFNIPQPLTSVTVMHPAYPEPNPQSNRPICVAFDLTSAVAPFDYSLSANPSTLSVTKSSSNVFAQETITKTLTAGTIGLPVSLSLTGVPSGVTSSISNSSCSPDCTSTVTFTVSPSASAGTYPITVTGSTGPELPPHPDRQTSFNLVISNAPLNVTCVASPTVAKVGETVTWTANVNGGQPPYAYSWSGTNVPTNPAPSTNPFTITYSTIGQKTATATVTDNSASGSQATCLIGSTVQVFIDPSFEEF